MQLILKGPTSSTYISSPTPVLKYHINTVSITSFLRNTFTALQEESIGCSSRCVQPQVSHTLTARYKRRVRVVATSPTILKIFYSPFWGSCPLFLKLLSSSPGSTLRFPPTSPLRHPEKIPTKKSKAQDVLWLQGYY